ncbi:MAG: L-seryl-tRNA(Sec) selenium transferase [Planctomycetes bacterium]|nr:L-seryl-tRNA(Sec) selenium transferase [Planctomycetota bacterium]
MTDKPPRIPAMNELLDACAAHDLDCYPREACRRACEMALNTVRAARKSGDVSAAIGDSFWREVKGHLEVLPRLDMCKVINATGVVLHTNLGRAQWPDEARMAAAAASAAAMCEIDAETGGRGKRDAAVCDLLAQLTGAEAGLPVNNNAATVLLIAAALGQGRKVVVARSELVEIGGSYRMPEVIAAAGAEMVAVGTTNRAHLKDFAEALKDPEVACVMRIHPSNFVMQGFTAEPEMSELSELCKEHGVPLYYDLGSGVLHGAALNGLEDEHPVRAMLNAGCDLVSFSGDKLLGGPQAGLIVGAAPLVAQLRSNMLTRCLRLDKTILAGVEATLRLHLLGEESAIERIPALSQLSQNPDDLKMRAESFSKQINSQGVNVTAELVECQGRVGSGASPIKDLPSWGVALTHSSLQAKEFARQMRVSKPHVFGRMQDDKLVLDLRTISDAECAIILDMLARKFSEV